MTTDTSPIVAVALFFDDIRIELGNKLSLMGNYTTALSIPSAGVPVDRLGVFLHIRWNPDDHHPADIAARIVVPGQPPVRQAFPAPQITRESAGTPFKATIVQAVMSLRFPPLRVGDAIEVWAEIDGVDYPAGRLRVDAAPSVDASAKSSTLS